MDYIQNEIYELVEDVDNIQEDVLVKLSKDLIQASATLSQAEVRYLVDSYYQMQNDRMRAKNQIRASKVDKEPHAAIAWFSDNKVITEKRLKQILTAYAASNPVGRWSMSICGIGGVISAGMLAHIDMEKVHNVGQILSFAGLLPVPKPWTKGMKRPHNAKLKTLTWKIGESFVKVSNKDKDFYGKYYKEAKLTYIHRNQQGYYIEECAKILADKSFKESTDAKAWYSGQYDVVVNNWLASCDLKPMTLKQLTKIFDDENYAELLADPKFKSGLEFQIANFNGQPMLPPAHIQARAKRKAVQLFLSHWFEVAYYYHHGTYTNALPYIIEKGHSGYIAIPNCPYDDKAAFDAKLKAWNKRNEEE